MGKSPTQESETVRGCADGIADAGDVPPTETASPSFPSTGAESSELVGGLTKSTGGAQLRRERRPRVTLARGTTVGRYVVVDELGAGAMGAVYRAYDPELDRSIALKVVSVVADNSETASNAGARLVREARALAQLSHPNVVAIHDVGSFRGDVFIAMGLVEGQTLRQWKRDSDKRSVAEIIAVFSAAGRGLAAAHRAGLVHRDFKPDNVLLGNDGRVQVVDFGIACAQDHSEQVGFDSDPSGTGQFSSSADSMILASRESMSAGSQSPGLSAPLTRAGVMLGTPAYMSPEQFLCHPVDAKSDQYSFCVALYETLFGTRPYSGRRMSDLRRRVLLGKLPEPPSDSRVPARVRRIVERGLSVSPEDRYPTMAELLADLGRDPRAAAKRAGVTFAALAVAALALVAIIRGGNAESTLCKGAAKELAGNWDDPRRATARSAFLATGRPFAGEAFDRVANALDHYAEQWIAMRSRACEATHVAGTQSERLLDLRMSCLDRRLDALSALVTVFAGTVDSSMIEKALPAALGLPAIKTCADERALTAAIPPPEDPETRRVVAELRRKLADARALKTTGRYRDGLTVVHEVASRTAEITYEPLRAETAFLTGALQLGAGDYDAAESALRSAILHGSRARDDSLVADSWIELLQTLSEQASYEQALTLIPSGEAAVARAGDTPRQRGELERTVGSIRYLKGEFDTAIEHQIAALELTESALGPNHPTVATTANSLANVYYRQGNHEKARELYLRALAIRESAFGEQHPLVALSVYNLAMLAYAEPDYQRSEELFTRALRLFKAAYGDEHPHTGSAYHGLGTLFANLGRYAEAEPLLRRSLEIREQAIGKDHPLTGSCHFMLGVVLNDAERYAEAESHLRKAAAMWEEKLGPKHHKLAYAQMSLGHSLTMREDFANAIPHYIRALQIVTAAFAEENEAVAIAHSSYAFGLAQAGRHGEAARSYRRAISILEKRFGPDHAKVSPPLSGLGHCYLEMGNPQKARPLFERALAIETEHPGRDKFGAARIEIGLAQTLWRDPAEHPRALSLAASARTAFAQNPRPRAAMELARVDNWLRKRGASAASAARE